MASRIDASKNSKKIILVNINFWWEHLIVFNVNVSGKFDNIINALLNNQSIYKPLGLKID